MTNDEIDKWILNSTDAQIEELITGTSELSQKVRSRVISISRIIARANETMPAEFTHTCGI